MNEEIGKGVKIVLADDEESMRSLLDNMLRKLSCEVADTAKDGRSALAAFQKYRPDILLLDISMPGEMSGLDVLKAVRAESPESHVVIVSGETKADLVRQIISAGANGFIVKPFSFERLIKMLEEYRKKRLSSKANS
ncbi:response regulator [Ectothiorhodospiraceae bacterium BW-2]|nr:response regulator [Ectothiorhodospiraceae bacterium BW-2]